MASQKSLMESLDRQLGTIEAAEYKAMQILQTMFKKGDRVQYQGRNHTVVGFDARELGVLVKAGVFGSVKVAFASDLS